MTRAIGFPKLFGLALLALLVAASVGLYGIAIADDDDAATVIDFETGFVDLQRVGVVSVDDENTVTFSIGPVGGSPAEDAYIAERGLPLTGVLGPGGANDSPINGDFFLADNGISPFVQRDFFIDFATAVGSLSLVAYDLDQGGTATLNVYADAARTHRRPVIAVIYCCSGYRA